MYDKAKVVPGLAVFLALVSLPFWYGFASGATASPPEVEIATGEEQCVEPTQYMREQHMQLLERWRQSVVRDGERTYIASDGREYDISLTGTCLSCHSNKETFCDRCHGYVKVAPGCWDCHNLPGKVGDAGKP